MYTVVHENEDCWVKDCYTLTHMTPFLNPFNKARNGLYRGSTRILLTPSKANWHREEVAIARGWKGRGWQTRPSCSNFSNKQENLNVCCALTRMRSDVGGVRVSAVPGVHCGSVRALFDSCLLLSWYSSWCPQMVATSISQTMKTAAVQYILLKRK